MILRKSPTEEDEGFRFKGSLFGLAGVNDEFVDAALDYILRCQKIELFDIAEGRPS